MTNQLQDTNEEYWQQKLPLLKYKLSFLDTALCQKKNTNSWTKYNCYRNVLVTSDFICAFI